MNEEREWQRGLWRIFFLNGDNLHRWEHSTLRQKHDDLSPCLHYLLTFHDLAQEWSRVNLLPNLAFDLVTHRDLSDKEWLIFLACPIPVIWACWTTVDWSWPKSGLSVRNLFSTLKKVQVGNELSNSLPKSSHARKTHHHHPQSLICRDWYENDQCFAFVSCRFELSPFFPPFFLRKHTLIFIQIIMLLLHCVCDVSCQWAFLVLSKAAPPAQHF